MKPLLSLLALVFALNMYAQNSTKEYTIHKVIAKENWYSVGRKYEMSPRDIAAYNELTIEQGLKIGQVIKIPRNKSVAVSTETPTPVKPQAAPAVNIQAQAEKKPEVAVPTKVGYNISGGGGFFESSFQTQAKEGKVHKIENPVFGTFKSTSGWQDGKYYVLMNEVVPGTIVKIESKPNRKSIYAKVLGNVPPGKESEGMALRMSNATFTALGLDKSADGLELTWFNE